MDRYQSRGAMVITAPSDHEVRYEMAVKLERMHLITIRGYRLQPWVVVHLDEQTGNYHCAAGMTAHQTRRA